MLSRTLKIHREPNQIILRVQPGPISEGEIQAELREVVFAHNEAYLIDGRLRPELEYEEMRRVRDLGPQLAEAASHGGPVRLDSMVMVPAKLPAVQAALEAKGFTIEEE